MKTRDQILSILQVTESYRLRLLVGVSNLNLSFKSMLLPLNGVEVLSFIWLCLITGAWLSTLISPLRILASYGKSSSGLPSFLAVRNSIAFRSYYVIALSLSLFFILQSVRTFLHFHLD